MWVTEVLPASGERADAATDDGRAWLADRYRRSGGAYVRLNMVASLTGAAVGADGTSDTLTNRVDRAILGLIRADADVVLVGAQTVRAEGYLVPRRARLAVVSTSGDLGGHRLDVTDAADAPVLLLVPGGAPQVPAAPGIRIVRVGEEDDRVDPEAALAALGGLGLTRIVCEGGPRLATQLAAAGLIDEYCVTTAPTLAPAASPFLDLATPVPTTVAGLLVDEAGFSYRRLRAR